MPRAPFLARFLVAAAALALVTAGCKSSEPPAVAPASAPSPATAAAAANAPSFSKQIAPYLAQTCAQANSCHGPHPSMSVDLDLRAGASYAQLVGHYSEQRVGGTRVKPGDTDGSFLVAKLVGALQKGEGKTMPLDPNNGRPVQPVPFDPDFVNNVLKPWIAAGAPNN